MKPTQWRGAAGERLAVAYLELSGYSIEARNVRIAGVEVDVVASDGTARVLIEVKFRSRHDYGGAALAVDRRKRERLLRAARAVANRDPASVRIDVIAIEPVEGGAVIRHYRGAVAEDS